MDYWLLEQTYVNLCTLFELITYFSRLKVTYFSFVQIVLINRIFQVLNILREFHVIDNTSIYIKIIRNFDQEMCKYYLHMYSNDLYFYSKIQMIIG